MLHPFSENPNPCLSLSIAPLVASSQDHYAIWVWQAPHPGGRVHHDQMWTPQLDYLWQMWQNVFSERNLPDVPRVTQNFMPPPIPESPPTAPGQNYTGRLMQDLGVNLWQWLFDGAVQGSLDQSQGIAIGQKRSLRLRLEILDPDLIALPWEIMQPQPGKQAISLNHQQLLFSRTTNDVDPLPPLREEQTLNILLVLGQDEGISTLRGSSTAPGNTLLRLKQEAEALSRLLESSSHLNVDSLVNPVPCKVKTLLQPTPAELIDELEAGQYNVMFYSGHGMPAPDGGLLFLRPDARINGTELAQVLTRCKVKLAVFNACWGAQPDQTKEGKAIPRSSLAEVLIHHGVPAVLGMRDTIADQEAITFIQELAKALSERKPIDEAVAIARQCLLTLYRFNQPTWTLPVLYMHPEFNGELIRPLPEGVMTQIPTDSPSWIGRETPPAFLRSLTPPSRVWQVQGGMMRVGSMEGNDLVLQTPGVSRKHAEIFYRDSLGNNAEATYFLRDFSRFGTFVLGPQGWYKVHQQEVPLRSQSRLKFGNFQIEFVVDGAISSH